MKSRLLVFWNNLNGNQRRLVVWVGGGCIFLAAFFSGNMAMNRGKNPLPTKSAKQTTLDIEPKLLAIVFHGAHLFKNSNIVK